jgi:hypothetical protein
VTRRKHDDIRNRQKKKNILSSHSCNIVEGVYKSFLHDKRNSAVDAQGLSMKHVTATQALQDENFRRYHTQLFSTL